MTTTEDNYEYELIDISFSSPYEIEIEDTPYKVCEDSPSSHNGEENKTIIHCDNDGVPIGRSKEEIKKREKIIKLTVGYQKKTSENVQYSITSPNNEKSHP